jgi:hypothetical protein
MTRLLGALARDLGPTGEAPSISSFVRGLTAGALIGAAIAGSALLQRRRAAQSHAESGGEPKSAEPMPAEPTPAVSVDVAERAPSENG